MINVSGMGFLLEIFGVCAHFLASTEDLMAVDEKFSWQPEGLLEGISYCPKQTFEDQSHFAQYEKILFK